MKTCFLLFVAEDVSAAAAALEPIELGTPEVESIDTLVGDRALMTVLWKRAGMELASCVVVGRIRRAGWRHDTQVPAFIREVCAGRRHWTLTDLDRGGRAARRLRRGHGYNVHRCRERPQRFQRRPGSENGRDRKQGTGRAQLRMAEHADRRTPTSVNTASITASNSAVGPSQPR